MSYPTDSVEGRFLQGDPEAVGEVSRWVARMVTLPRFWALRGQWDDLHQEILGRITESLRHGRFDSRREFKAYVQGVARFTGMDATSRQGRYKAAEDLDPDRLPAPGGDPERAAAARNLARVVLDNASEECRAIIRAYYFEGKSYREIAAGRNMPVGTVKSRLFRCLSAAQEKLRVAPEEPGNLSAARHNR